MNRLSKKRSLTWRAAAMAATVLLLPAGAGAGVATWTTAGPEGGPVLDLTFDGSTPGALFAATRHNGVFRSADSGGTWTAANVALPPEISALAWSPGGRVFAIGRDDGIAIHARSGKGRHRFGSHNIFGQLACTGPMA